MKQTVVSVPSPLQEHLRGMAGMKISVSSFYHGTDGIIHITIPISSGMVSIAAEGGGYLLFQNDSIILEHWPQLWLRSVVVSLVETSETVEITLPRGVGVVTASTDEAVYKVWTASKVREDVVVRFKGGSLDCHRSGLFAMIAPHAE